MNNQQDIDELYKVPKYKVAKRIPITPKKVKSVDNSHTIVSLSERVSSLEKEVQKLYMIVFATNKKYKHLTDSVNDGNHSKSSSLSK